ncbi:MAG: polyphosphate polymerase domain-containing protein [Bacteroidota bacterium]|nr:polyphosphate polymerase domain-containing protein [Bacteroidota bacterium]MDP4272719.1 polyphosphate polymerase domain-containing protein [Bacteroidota bacterium]
MPDLENLLSLFMPVKLEELNSEVELMNRIDMKFLFPISKLAGFLKQVQPLYYSLLIDNRRIFNYQSIYYDTSDLFMYQCHQKGMLNRFKIRRRKYLDSQIDYLEIKLKNDEGRTIKKRIRYPGDQQNIDLSAHHFIASNSPFKADQLTPTLEVNFKRITLVHKSVSERVTLDFNLSFKNKDGELEVPNLVIAEIKRGTSPVNSDFAGILQKKHIKSSEMSKYAMGIALLSEKNFIKDNPLLNPIDDD